MAEIIITIPANIFNRVIDGVADTEHYDANKLESETKTQFAKRMVIRYISSAVKKSEAGIAVSTARELAFKKAKTDINLG